MAASKHITVIPGDGVGPECVAATMKIIQASGAQITWEEHHAGASVFKQGIASGVPQSTIDSINKTRCVLKGPLETPIGYGEKSANVTLRKLFETYANIRPVRELPGVKTPYSGRGIDLVVVRENVEDLYAGIEHMQTPDVAQCLKLISSMGSEKIARFALEFARSEGRKQVACATKANIMKLTEGLVKRTFERVAKEYADLETWHIIIDNCAHQLVKKPEQFDVIVTTNMNGDIISDLTSALVGGLGFAPSANIGNDVAIFEAVHGSAPKYSGKNCINPTAVLLSGVMMLRYLGDYKAADDIEHAVLVTLEQGFHTGDVVGYDKGVSTTDYADRIISNLGKRSANWKVRDHHPIKLPKLDWTYPKYDSHRVAGVDVFIQAFSKDASHIGSVIETAATGTAFKLKMISNRGTRVYPPTGAITDLTMQSRCRFVLTDEAASATDDQIFQLLQNIVKVGKGKGANGSDILWSHIEKLNVFNGENGWTKAQGED
jgi:isocitrate dehydrogenase